MSAADKTGGPAFPLDYESAAETQGKDVSKYGTGMTLRDYFAAKYMQGYMANADMVFSSRDVAASEAYKMADAMLAARQGGAA